MVKTAESVLFICRCFVTSDKTFFVCDLDVRVLFNIFVCDLDVRVLFDIFKFKNSSFRHLQQPFLSV